ncbi:rolling circle replication-associated protein [Zobellia uliginosa]|uniref:rolling circle replication-associated protein n=1 Tax=Zobellia uliginosa TaxID=143224 RepID=UPI003F5326E9|nr:hypothetical protein [Zobellia uliginosa]
MIYTDSTRELVKVWGEFLGTISWDYFSTLTYPFDMNARINERLILKLENELLRHKKTFNFFCVSEYHSNGTQTHNHLLIQGEWVRNFIDDYLIRNKLVRKQGLRHLPYDPQKGAPYYISKHINSPNTRHHFNYYHN